MKERLLQAALALAIVLIIASCGSDTGSESDQIQRPYEPWISRSVLDEQPRMLVLALHEDIWVAYSTENCSVYKAWKGYVEFDGAVYTTAHGPQPVAVGDAYFVSVFDNPWMILNGTERSCNYRPVSRSSHTW